MKDVKLIFLLLGLLIQQIGFRQNESIIQNDYSTVATLVVDYDSYAFEGGNITYYTCPGCPTDSFPFTVNYIDLSSVTFQLLPTEDTIFYASIIPMGVGQIYQPNEFSTQTPFNKGLNAVNKSDDMKYLKFDGSETTNPSFTNKADSAWDVIKSLQVTELFAEKGFKSAIYLYPPKVTIFDPREAKWIIFLYYNDRLETKNKVYRKDVPIQIFPNPTTGILHIEGIRPDTTIYEIFNSAGQLIKANTFSGN